MKRGGSIRSISLLLLLTLFAGCNVRTVFEIEKNSGAELALRKAISINERLVDGVAWDDDDLTQWFACEVYYYKKVPGLSFRQKAEDTGYIVFSVTNQLYYFVHGVCRCEEVDHDGVGIGCLDLNQSNLRRVILR